MIIIGGASLSLGFVERFQVWGVVFQFVICGFRVSLGSCSYNKLFHMHDEYIV